MKRILNLSIITICISSLYSCGDSAESNSNDSVSTSEVTYGTITDNRNNREYKTVVINGKTWMAENLDVETFRNGDVIPELKGNGTVDDEWRTTTEAAWCYYDNDPNNGKVYGRLYNHSAIIDARGLAPEGWHIATVEDWKQSFPDLSNAGFIMKDPSNWSVKQGYSNKGDNSSGFNALAGGKRHHLDGFQDIYGRGWWWADKNDGLYCFYLKSEFNSLEQTGLKNGRTGLSVRCVKD